LVSRYFGIGLFFLISGAFVYFYGPAIPSAFYEYTGLDDISIYQNKEVISQMSYGMQLGSLPLVIAGLGCVIYSPFDSRN